MSELSPILFWMADNVDLWRGQAIAVLALFFLAVLCWAEAAWGDLE